MKLPALALAAPQTQLSPSHLSIRRHLTLGVSLVILLTCVLGGWAATAELSGAVISHGALVVDSNVKKVQHPTGGVVGALLVKEGDTVKAGDVVMRLDPTQARAGLQIVVNQLNELLARQAREQAEQSSSDTIEFPQELLDKQDKPDVAHAIAGERRLFEIRRAARDGQKSQLSERMTELEHEISGYDEQIRAKADQLDYIGQELKSVRNLLEKKLVQFNRVAALERDRAQLNGERGQLVANIAGAKGKIAETQLQILQVDHDMRSEVAKDLAEIRSKISELIERRAAAEDQLERIDLRSPQDGVVSKLDVHTIGGVVRAGDTVMEIVPLGDELMVESKLSPTDINDVHIGQKATLRFSGINQRTTPEVDGHVALVSADITQDPRTGASYYQMRIAVSKEQFDRMKGVRLMPGMPVEAFVQTQQRTALSYLVQPLSDQVARAFREK